MDWREYRDKICQDGFDENYFVIGIDLGTTNSVISYYDAETNKPIPIDVSNGFGKIPLPSVVQIINDECVVGEQAQLAQKIYPKNTVNSIKTKMGTNEQIVIDGKKYLPEEISAMILKQLIANCKNINPNGEIASIVISVPYDFDDSAKRATMKACEIAGIDESVVCLIEEPKAIALAYSFNNTLNDGEKIFIFDFGGGTLDLTLFEVKNTENVTMLKVISGGGSSNHGGDNVDTNILNYCYEVMKTKNGLDRNDISIENQVELQIRAREAKERLTGAKVFRIPFTFCAEPFIEALSREKFEQINDVFVKKTRALVLKTLREAYTGALMPSDIDKVILCGGSSCMVWVSDMLSDIFGREKIYQSEKPALDISIGACYYSAMQMGLVEHKDIRTENNIQFELSVPHDIGLEIIKNNKPSFFCMVKRGTSYSLAKKAKVFNLKGETEEDMTQLELVILERLNKDDTVDKCKVVGIVSIQELPQRPSGKTNVEVSLSVSSNTGVVTGKVVDKGYYDEYEKTGYVKTFSPNRHDTTVVK